MRLSQRSVSVLHWCHNWCCMTNGENQYMQIVNVIIPAMLFTSLGWVSGWPLHVSGREGLWWRMPVCRVWTCLTSMLQETHALNTERRKESNQNKDINMGGIRLRPDWISFSCIPLYLWSISIISVPYNLFVTAAAILSLRAPPT